MSGVLFLLISHKLHSKANSFSFGSQDSVIFFFQKALTTQKHAHKIHNSTTALFLGFGSGNSLLG